MVSTSANAGRARRASRPKVKTGCGNCKTRRVKCDETRPQCTNCVRAGRQCDGYPAYRRAGEVAIAIAPRPRQSPSSAASQYSYPSPASSAATSSSSPGPSSIAPKTVTRIIRRVRPPAPKAAVIQQTTQPISFSPTLLEPGGYAFNTREGQYFQVFRTHTAGELSGFFDSEFWTRSVLQESHGEASIRHAVVALGALYKTLEKASESPPTSPQSTTSAETAPEHYTFALSQYGKALKRLQEYIKDNGAQSQRTVLISIVLFTCFQSFTGDHRSAIGQIQSGLRLLQERRPELKHLQAGRFDSGVEDELVQMFTRLAIQAKSYDMAFHFPPPYVIQLTPDGDVPPPSSFSFQGDSPPSSSLQSEIPERFTTSQEARASLDTLCERLMRINEALSWFYAGPDKILPSSIQKHGSGYGTQLEQWATAFEPLLQNRRSPGISKTERAGINVIKMMHTMTMILFLMGFSVSETDFDRFVPQFREIVDLANEVVIDEELAVAQARYGDPGIGEHRSHSGPNQMRFPGMVTHGHAEEPSFSHNKASFALDLGIVPPLFVVATKCRDRVLRRETIGLLMRSPRREGMWDSLLCGRVAKWVMDVEEEGMSKFETWNPLSTSEVPVEEKRVMVKQILFDMQRREATIRCGTRGTKIGQDDPRARETHINW